MATTRFIVTASFTEDGAVAWRRADGSWTRAFTEAGPLEAEADAKALAAAAGQREQRLVSDPYVIEVAFESGDLRPLSARERIRATGPTIRVRRPD